MNLYTRAQLPFAWLTGDVPLGTMPARVTPAKLHQSMSIATMQMLSAAVLAFGLMVWLAPIARFTTGIELFAVFWLAVLWIDTRLAVVVQGASRAGRRALLVARVILMLLVSPLSAEQILLWAHAPEIAAQAEKNAKASVSSGFAPERTAVAEAAAALTAVQMRLTDAAVQSPDPRIETLTAEANICRNAADALLAIDDSRNDMHRQKMALCMKLTNQAARAADADSDARNQRIGVIKRQVEDAKLMLARAETTLGVAINGEEARLAGELHSSRARLEAMFALAKADWAFCLQAILILMFLWVLELLGWIAKFCGGSVLALETRAELQQAQYDAQGDATLAGMRSDALFEARTDARLRDSVHALECDKMRRVLHAVYARETADMVAQAAGLDGPAQEVMRNTAALHAVAGGLAKPARQG